VHPLHRVVELTYRAISAARCLRHPREHEGELSTQEWFQVLDQLSEAGTLYLEITGGEIFIRRDIWEILAYARRSAS